MNKIRNKFKLSFFVGLSAALVAGSASFYSIFGLAQLFAGASLAVIIMASSLEFSKVVAVSFLHRYWSKISKALRVYLSIGVIILITITSAGIYGFLSNAYQKTAHKLEINEGVQGVLTNKKSLFEKSITDNQNIVKTKTARLEQLNNLRTTQEIRLDAANNASNRGSVRSDISISTKEIQKLNSEIDTLNTKNIRLGDSANYYANKILEVKSGDNAVGEVGPLKYIAQLTGYPMDVVVNYFILLLIFVFDPLAVALVIATNRVLEIEKENAERLDSKIIEPEIIPVTDVVPSQESILIEPETSNQVIIEDNLIEESLEEIKEDEEVLESEPLINEIDEVVFDEEPALVEESSADDSQETKPRKLELEDIKEIKEKLNRGFTANIPNRKNNTIQKIDDKDNGGR